jgi:hypothetical protein
MEETISLIFASAIAVGAVVRALKDDTVLPTVPKKWRPVLAIALGQVHAVLMMVVGGKTWKTSIIEGATVSVLAVAGHLVGIEKIRGGKEIPLPGLMRDDDDDDDPQRPIRIVGGLGGIIFLVTGCAGSLEETRAQIKLGAPPPSERCVRLDATRRDWGAVGKGAAVLAGASGLSTIPIEDEGVRVGLAVGSVAMGAVAATAFAVAEGASSSWVRECSQ